MQKQTVLIIVLVSLVGGLNGDIQLAPNQVPDEAADLLTIEESKETVPISYPPQPTGTRTALSNSKLIESNEHGGSWLDSFEDDSGIDWDLTNNIVLHNVAYQHLYSH